MEELKNALMEKLGLDEGGAGSAIETVVDFIKEKLPEGAQGMVDSVMGGEDASGSVVDKIKGLFGGE